MKKTLLRFGATLLCCLSALPVIGWAQSVEPLFFIIRSKNANKVYYEPRLTRDGMLDVKQPIHAYWILWAKDSTGKTREELTGMEKRLAFGFTVTKNTPVSCSIRLAAFRDRSIEVRFHGKKSCAETTIAGKPSYLKKISVISSEVMLVPHVSSATLFGNDTASGAEMREVITPK